jgi:hypothetical protein
MGKAQTNWRTVFAVVFLVVSSFSFALLLGLVPGFPAIIPTETAKSCMRQYYDLVSCPSFALRAALTPAGAIANALDLAYYGSFGPAIVVLSALMSALVGVSFAVVLVGLLVAIVRIGKKPELEEERCPHGYRLDEFCSKCDS